MKGKRYTTEEKIRILREADRGNIPGTNSETAGFAGFNAGPDNGSCGFIVFNALPIVAK
jgi:hypothetical protein